MQKIIGEIFLDHIALVTTAHNKLRESMVGIYFHQMPEYWTPPISIIGFGRKALSSEILVPNPPASITIFIFDNAYKNQYFN